MMPLQSPAPGQLFSPSLVLMCLLAFLRMGFPVDVSSSLSECIQKLFAFRFGPCHMFAISGETRRCCCWRGSQLQHALSIPRPPAAQHNMRAAVFVTLRVNVVQFIQWRLLQLTTLSNSQSERSTRRDTACWTCLVHESRSGFHARALRRR